MKSKNEPEEQYLNILQYLPDIVYKIDPRGNFTFVNNSVRMLGYKPEELIGQHFSKIIHPDDVKLFARQYVLKKYKGKDTSDETPPKLFDERRTGQRKTTNLSIRLIPNKRKRIKEDRGEITAEVIAFGDVSSTGHYATHIQEKNKKFLGTLGIIRDISERKRAEQALRESEKRFRTLVEKSVEAIFLINFKTEFVFWNPAAEKLIGLTTTPKKKITLFNVLTPSSLKIAMANVSKAALTGTTRPKPYELTVKRLDGTLVDVEVFIGLVQYEGKPHMLGTARDITERKRAYEMLQKSKEKYRLLSENVPAVVYSALPDKQSSNLFISSKAEELTGYNAEQFLQSPELWDDIIHPEDREYVWQKIEEHRKKKIVLYVEYRIITKDKKIKWIKDTATPVFDNNGHIVRIDGFMEDITERKRVEESLKKKNEELERFNKFAVGRELKMIELKKKINELLLKMDKKPKYKIPERINTEINK